MSEDVPSPATAVLPGPVREAHNQDARTAFVQRLWTAKWQVIAERHKGAIAALVALALYTTIALLYFWWPIHSSPSTLVISNSGPDTGQNFWYLRWWPYAITHGLNPFITYKMWSPFGYNLAWQQSLPGPSLVLFPVASVTGILMAYNIYFISSFVLTAWTMYILCYHFVRQIWASLIGGYLFGFSGFMLAQSTGHINKIALYVIPFSVYLYVLRKEKRLSRLGYLLLGPLPLIWAFLTTVELFAFVAMFAYIAVALYWVFVRSERRKTFILALEMTATFLISALLLTPYLYYMVIGYSPGAVHSLGTYSGDVLGFIAPTYVFFFFSNHFHALPLAGGNATEQDSYLGLPLVLIMFVFAVKYWSKPIGKVLILVALIGVAFTLGPYITIAKVQVLTSPMYYLFKLPILEKSLPIRYAFIVAFIGAFMAAIWLAREVKHLPSKIILGLATAVVLIPNLGTGEFVSKPPIPAFFTTAMYQSYIKPNDVVLILPLGYAGNDMSWQQAANFSFTLSGGYGGTTPHPDEILPIDYLLYTADATPYLVKSGNKVVGNTYVYDLEQYIATRHVSNIVVDDSVYPKWSQYLSFLHENPVHVGGIWYYTIPPVFSQAMLPGQTVAGDAVPRPYNLVSASWSVATQTIVMPQQNSGEAVETIPDQFASGYYAMTITVSSSSTAPVATAQIFVNGVPYSVALANGTTRATFHVAANQSTVLAKIISVGGASFRVGNMVMSRTG